MKKIAIIALIALFGTACGPSEEKKQEPTQQEEGPAERAGKKIDQNMDEMQRKADELKERSLELKKQMQNKWDKSSNGS